MTDDLDPSLELFIKAAHGKKAYDVVVLDVHQLTSVADVFIICSGRSNRQVSAIADYIQTELKTHGKKPLSVDGINEGLWALLDYGHVVIHVFYDSIRRFYDLEGLWIDAKRIKTERYLDTTPENDESPDTDDFEDDLETEPYNNES